MKKRSLLNTKDVELKRKNRGSLGWNAVSRAQQDRRELKKKKRKKKNDRKGERRQEQRKVHLRKAQREKGAEGIDGEKRSRKPRNRSRDLKRGSFYS